MTTTSPASEFGALMRPVLVLFVFFTLLTGVLYPLGVTAAASLLFPSQAQGSLVTVEGKVRASALVGQSFESSHYFWGRPSATPKHPYDASSSSGSNWALGNSALHERIAGDTARLLSGHDSGDARIPVDLVTASGSGLDPHISPAAARWQIERVARARKVSREIIETIVEAHVEPRTLSVLGEPRVNVVALNIALDQQLGAQP